MKTMILFTGLALAFSAAPVSADEPPPDVFPIPELHGFPKSVAAQLKRDMERAQRDVRRGLQGVPFPIPQPLEFPKAFRLEVPVIPELPLGDFDWDERTSSSWSCVNGKFTMSHRKNDVTYKVSGCMKKGEAICEKITIKDGKETTSYECLEDVPECHRKTIRNLLEKE